MKRTRTNSVVLLLETRKSRLAIQQLLHVVPASDPVSLARVRAMLADLDAIISHLEVEIYGVAAADTADTLTV